MARRLHTLTLFQHLKRKWKNLYYGKPMLVFQSINVLYFRSNNTKNLMTCKPKSIFTTENFHTLIVFFMLLLCMYRYISKETK